MLTPSTYPVALENTSNYYTSDCQTVSPSHSSPFSPPLSLSILSAPLPSPFQLPLSHLYSSPFISPLCYSLITLSLFLSLSLLQVSVGTEGMHEK